MCYLPLTWSEAPQIKCIHSCPYGRTSKRRRRKTINLYKEIHNKSVRQLNHNVKWMKIYGVKNAIKVLPSILWYYTGYKKLIFKFSFIAVSGQMLLHWLIFFTFANLAIKSKIKDLFSALYFFGLRKIQFRKLFRSSFSTDMTIMRFAFLPDLNFWAYSAWSDLATFAW